MDMPPQILKQQVRNLAANQDIQSLRDGAGLQAFGNRLPVLQAFQEFLEIERRQARKRMAVAVWTFLGILLAILFGGGALFYTFVSRTHRDVRNLEKALAVARDESGALRGDAHAMQRALDDAKQAIAALQQRSTAGVEYLGEAAGGIDLTRLATILDVLQDIQQVESRVPTLSSSVDAVQRDLDKLLADQLAVRQREERVATSHTELMRGLAELNTREERAAETLSAIPSSSPSALNAPLARGTPGKKVGAATPTPPAVRVSPSVRVVAVLDELNEIRFQHQLLVLRQTELQAESDAISAEKKAVMRRALDLRIVGGELLQNAQQALAQQQEFAARIDNLRAPTDAK